MKILLCALLASVDLFAAGIVQQTTSQLGNTGNWVVAFQWTGDASSGAVPTTAWAGSGQTGPACCQGYQIVQVETVPLSPAPTNGYSVQITDAAGVDALNGAAGSLSNSASQSFAASAASPPIQGAMNLVITGTTVVSAKGTVFVFLSKPGTINVAKINGGGGSNSANWLTIANPPFADARRYNWTPQSPGGSISVGNHTITLSPGPSGVAYNDPNLRLYISGGTGTAESVAPSGGLGTCDGTGTQKSCTIPLAFANTHSGNWNIRSSTQGIYEATAANPYNEVVIPQGIYSMHDCLILNPQKALILSGYSYDPAGSGGTILAFAPVTSTTCPAGVMINASVGFPINPITIRNLLIVGGGAVTPLWNGLLVENVTRVNIDNVMVSGFAGSCIETLNAFEVYITNRTYAQDCGQWGASINGTANLVSIEDSAFAFNSRSNGFGNVSIQGNASPNVSAAVYLKGVDMEAAGGFPFTTVTTAFGLAVTNTTSLTLIGNYVESNLGGSPNVQAVFGSGITSLTEIGNLYSAAGTTAGAAAYDASITAVNSFGNTYFEAPSIRTFDSSDLSTYVIGPDSCLAGSTECTAHPRLLGMAGSTGSGSALLGGNSPASTNTAPYTWLKMIGPDGSTVYIPAWK